MSEKSKLLKNTGLIAIGNFGAKMISFLLLPLYTSILTTSEYGTYDLIVAISAFLLPVVTLSMHEALFRFVIDTGSKGEEYKKVITNAFFIVVLGIGTMGMGLMFVGYFLKSSITIYVFVYVLANALYVFANNMLRGLGKIKEFAIVSSSKNVMQLIANVIAVAVLRWGMEGLLFALCVSEMIAFIVVSSMSGMWRQIRIKSISGKHIKEMLAYSLPLIPNALCAQIINISDRLVIKGFLNDSANGIYAVSYKFPTMVDTMYHFFYMAWSENASRVFARGKEEANKYYQSLYVTIDNMMFSVILLMTAGMPIMFRILIRGNYVQGFDYVPLLLLAMYFSSIAKFYSGIFTALKKTRIMATSTVVAAVINIVLNILLIGKIGLYAAAGSTLIANIALALIRKKFLEEDIKFKSNRVKIAIRIAIICLIMALYDYGNWYKIVSAISIATIYALIDNRQVIADVKRMLTKKLRKVKK